MKNYFVVVISLLVGVVIGFAFSPLGVKAPVNANEGEPKNVEPEILYWVAPMDSNYRRDKPGKSPMGMDLVPVYADDEQANDKKGTVKISSEVENSIGVRTAKVQFGALTRSIHTSGYIDFDQDRLAHVYPRVEGWIEQLWVSAVGDEIAIGAPLFSLYSPTLVNAQEEYLAALKRNNRAIVMSSFNRLLALGISKAQIEHIKSNGKVLQKVVIHATHQGFLTEQNIREGQYIRPQDKLMSIVDKRSVWVMVEVFERQAMGISEGMAATMTVDAIGGRSWQGKVAHIHPFLLSQTRTLRLRLHFDNEDLQLRPNMFARVSLDVSTKQDVISVPRQAVIRTGRQDRVVLALGDGKFRSVAVDVGFEADGQVEIIRGLSTDDDVVTSAQFLLDSESSIEGDFARMTVEDNAHQYHQMDHSKMNHGDMDHSKMNHGDMDHSKMNHGDMDHSKMNHGDMDHSKMNHGDMDHSKMNHGDMDHSNMNHGDEEDDNHGGHH